MNEQILLFVGGPMADGTDCPRSARMASYMQAACSLAVKQSGNLILELNIKYGNPTPESKVSLHLVTPRLFPPVHAEPRFPLTLRATSSVIITRRDIRFSLCAKCKLSPSLFSVYCSSLGTLALSFYICPATVLFICFTPSCRFWCTR